MSNLPINYYDVWLIDFILNEINVNMKALKSGWNIYDTNNCIFNAINYQWMHYYNIIRLWI